MLKYFIILITFCFWAIANDRAAFEQQSMETLALTFQAFEQEDSSTIWPHFHLSDRPAVFHFKNGHVYAMGLVRSMPVWEQRLIQRYPVLFCSQYPISLAPLHPSFPCGKQRAFVFCVDHGDETSFFPLLTFVHERFHLYQFQFFYKENIREAVAADYQNIDFLAWMELEHRLLTFFLQSSDPTSKLQHLKNYVAVSQTRRQCLQPASVLWEDHLQKMEGLADYVSVKTFQVFDYLPHFNAEEVLLEMRKKKTNGLIFSSQDIMKGRHYFVGAVLGWALDFCGITHWKWRIENEKIALQTMLENALYMEKREKQERLLHVQKTLNWMEIKRQIHQQLEKEKRKGKEILQAFAAQEGIIIRMGTPSGHMSSGGQHQKSCQISRINAKALMHDTSISSSQDQSWTARFTNFPLVFEEQNGERIFKLNPQAVLELDENQISLEKMLQENRIEVHFSSLSLKDDSYELNSKRSGKICIESEAIFLKFN